MVERVCVTAGEAVIRQLEAIHRDLRFVSPEAAAIAVLQCATRSVNAGPARTN